MIKVLHGAIGHHEGGRVVAITPEDGPVELGKAVEKALVAEGFAEYCTNEPPKPQDPPAQQPPDGQAQQTPPQDPPAQQPPDGQAQQTPAASASAQDGGQGEDKPKPIRLDQLKKEELEALAKERGVDYPEGTTAKELRAILKAAGAHLPVAAAASGDPDGPENAAGDPATSDEGPENPSGEPEEGTEGAGEPEDDDQTGEDGAGEQPPVIEAEGIVG